MYTLEQLEQKNIKQLKEIGHQLNVFPASDRRCRQTWIDAIAGVNPPLLALLEVSPAASVVEQVQPIIETVETPFAVEVEPVETLPIESKFGCIVYPRPAQKSIAPAAQNSPGVDPGVDVDRVSEPIALAAKNSPGVKVEQVQEPIVPTAKTSAEKVSSSKKVKASSYLDCPSCGPGRLLRVTKSIYWETSCTKCGYFAESILYPFTPAVTGYKVGDWVKLRIKPRLATNIRRGEVVCIDQVQDDYLRFVNPNLNPALVIWARREFLHPHEVFPCEPPVVKAAETFPGVKTEVTVSESAIAPAAKTSFDAESDRNPILTGIHLSDKFLARYSPPQPENICFQSEADGQLSLLNFEVVTEPDPPDPDDFETLDAFREDLALWESQHSMSFDHFSDLPSSVYSEPNSLHSDPLEVWLDSFCEWVPCPADWHEPVALQPSKVIELSLTCKSSSTSDFFIPTFDRLSDRPNRSDELPDTGIFVYLPKPKLFNFPPTVANPIAYQTQPNRIPNSPKLNLIAYQTHPNSTQTQPKLNSIAYQTQPKLNPNSTQSHRRWHQHATSPIASGR
jgi:ribosomal protein L37AE/L43A